YEYCIISYFRDSKCIFYTRDYKTSKYKYKICLKRDEIYQYSLLKYFNYKDKHASSLKE
ncbi:hypothetical protein BDBG_18082, partial [Blastomyces gilchristii SLH14081]